MRNWSPYALPPMAVLVGIYAALFGIYEIAEWIFGPYAHWTPWVRVPLLAAISATYLWKCWIRPWWRARGGS